MYQQPQFEVKGRTIEIQHLDLPSVPGTYLTSAVAALGTALTVQANSSFAQNDLILLGNLNSEATEITSISVAVTQGVSLTSTAVVFDHPVGTPIKKVQWNQYNIYGNSTNTTVGATLLTATAINIDVSAPFTSYVNTGTEYSFYFVRPYNSVGATSGDYSDGVASTGMAPGSVGLMIRTALEDSNKVVSSKLSQSWFHRTINDCLRFMSGKLKRWSGLQIFDYVLGQTSRGVYSYSLPDDIEERNTIKSILNVRIGGDTQLVYLDKEAWERQMYNVYRTTVRTQPAVGDTVLNIVNSYDFADSGTVHVSTSGTQNTITYTGVTRSATAGVLTGVPATGTGSIDVTHAVGTNVWQNEQENSPMYFTVYDGTLYIDLPDTTNVNKNVYLDYFSRRTAVNSDADTIEFPRYDAVISWLKWKIRSLDNANGQLDVNDGDFMMFNSILQEMVNKEVSGQNYRMKPKVNMILSRGTRYQYRSRVQE